MWNNLKGLIGNVAPTIATALGGPLAGGAVKLLTGALGLKDKATESQIMDAVANASPETAGPHQGSRTGLREAHEGTGRGPGTDRGW